LLLVAALGWTTGCASIGPPMPPSLELPKPPSDLRAARKGDKVTLTWTIPARTTDRQSVRYLGTTRICRSVDAALKQCSLQVGNSAAPAGLAKERKSAQRVTATFSETLPAAIEQEHRRGFANYAVEVLNTAGRSAGISNQAHVPLVPTLPPYSGFRVELTAKGVRISWQCPSAPGEPGSATKYLFRIYRHLESRTTETKVADVDVTKCRAAGESNSPEESNRASSFLDQTFEWEKTYFYRASVVSVVEAEGKPAAEVEGDDTPEVKVFAHDIFPPGVPEGLQAVFSGEEQRSFIDLIWAPVPDADLEGYTLYRRVEGSAVVKLNADPVKTPAFRDAHVESGKTYFYSVSAVDERGNESARSAEASERVP